MVVARLLRGRWLLVTLPLAFLVGYLLPVDVFLPIIALALVVAVFMLARVSEWKGYWKAHVEISLILQQVTRQADKTDSELLSELVNGLIFQAEMAAREFNDRSRWQRLVGRHRG